MARTYKVQASAAERKAFAARLRNAMARRCLTGAVLAEKSGVPATSIYSYTKAACFPSEEKAQAIANALGIELDELIPQDQALRSYGSLSDPVCRAAMLSDGDSCYTHSASLAASCICESLELIRFEAEAALALRPGIAAEKRLERIKAMAEAAIPLAWDSLPRGDVEDTRAGVMEEIARRREALAPVLEGQQKRPLLRRRG